MSDGYSLAELREYANKLLEQLKSGNAELAENEPIEVDAGEYGTGTVTIKFKLSDTKGVPVEVLEAVGVDDNELDRMMWKGSVSKRSFAGARYEVGLSNLMHSTLQSHPEHPSEPDWGNMTKEGLDAYENQRTYVWDNYIIPQFQHYIDELEENFR